MGNTPTNRSKAAESRAAAAQDSQQAPVERQTPEGQQQTTAPTAPSEAASDQSDDVDVEALVARLGEAVERAEAAADRAEKAASVLEGEPVHTTGTGPAVEKAAPEIGTLEWQRDNRVKALREELGFAEKKGQKDRAKEIRSEIDRLEKA
ncbi:hypothetical protein GCM10008944_01590 [Cytobacillus oceanisediminis]